MGDDVEKIWQSQFARDATYFTHLADFQQDQLLLSTMTEEAYRAASFLDQRIITPSLARQLVTWAEVAAIDLPTAPKPQYIFHIGHVGSTLISRLLGELETVLALREPPILRQLAEIYVTRPAAIRWDDGEFTRRLAMVESWLSRRFLDQQRVMIKASSFVSPLARQILAAGGDALFLCAGLERYLQTILAGEASQQEAAALADLRLLRLAKYDITIGDKMSLSAAQLAVLGWLTEMMTLCDTANHCPAASILWRDFDHFLAAPESQLIRIGAHFGRDISAERAAALISSKIMHSYSKAPEYDYSRQLREDTLAEAAQLHADDISKTLLWVEKLSQQSPLLAQALAHADKLVEARKYV